MLSFISNLLIWVRSSVWGEPKPKRKRKFLLLDAREKIFSPRPTKRQRIEPYILPLAPPSPSSSDDFVGGTPSVSLSSKSGYHCSNECEDSGDHR